jgi:hypothetical protein
MERRRTYAVKFASARTLAAMRMLAATGCELIDMTDDQRVESLRAFSCWTSSCKS